MREAVQKALDAYDAAKTYGPDAALDALDAIREALAEPDEAEALRAAVSAGLDGASEAEIRTPEDATKAIGAVVASLLETKRLLVQALDENAKVRAAHAADLARLCDAAWDVVP